MASRRRRVVLSLSLLLVLGALVVAYVLTFHLDTLQRLVREQIDQAFGETLQVGQVRISFFPHPQLELENVQVGQKGQNDPLFRATRLRLDLSFLSLLQDKVAPQHLMIEDPYVNLRRDQQGQWNLQDALKTPESNNMGLGAFLADYSITVVNGHVSLVDAYDRHEPQPQTKTSRPK